jgi:hypothetical protein
VGYDLLAGIGFVLLTPCVVLGFIVFWWMTDNERRVLEDEWRAFADKRGRDYEPAEGDWPNRTSPAVEWESDGVRFRLESRGKEANVVTRLVAWPDVKVLGVVQVKVDDGRIEFARVRVAQRLLTHEVRRRLLGFSQGQPIVFSFRRGRLLIEWSGREMNDARIDEAEQVLVVAVRALREAFVAAAAA